MKRIIFLSVSILFCLFTCAQSLDLQKLSEKKRNKFLEEKAKEVVRALAPEHYREYTKPIIMGPYDHDANKYKDVPNCEQYVGKQFYYVIIPYDLEKENLACDFAAKVGIWADDGKPMSLKTASNELTLSFRYYSFEQILKEDEHKEIRLQYRHFHEKQPIFEGASVQKWDPNAKRSWERFDEEYKKNKENEKK